MARATVKKQDLTLGLLANYDDIITDALVDRVYFWATIRKNRSRYFLCRGIREEEITSILRQSVIIEKDPAKACMQLLELPALKRKFELLPTENEKEHFQRHFRKYVDMYLPDCPFEISTTNRYTIDTQEAAITARKSIRKGELVKYLNGIQIPITAQEELDLDATKRNFSIIEMSPKRTPSLFLGPGRFANHDCGANARLTRRGASGIAIVAAKDIQLGDEITVSYGEAYFGADNYDCLCDTCERSQRNGWVTDVEDSLEDLGTRKSDSPYSFRHHRSGRSSAYAPLPSTPPSEPPARRSRMTKRDTLENYDASKDSPTHSRVNGLKMNQTLSKLSPEIQLEDDTQLEQRNRGVMVRVNQHGSRTSASGESTSPVSSKSLGSTAATSVSDKVVSTGERDELASRRKSMATASQRALYDVDVDAHGSTVSQPVTCPAKLQTPTTGNPIAMSGNRVITVDKNGSRANDSPLKRRTPGDYEHTKTLLALPSSRWVVCGTCFKHFVQSNAHQTRCACPRCERHSKLYGYAWPKTDKLGKNDTEVRILDHRTVHRFVFPDEEKKIKKGKNTSLRDILAENTTRAKSCVEDSEDDEPHSSAKEALRKRKREVEEEAKEKKIKPEASKRGGNGQNWGQTSNEGGSKNQIHAPEPITPRKSQAEETSPKSVPSTRKYMLRRNRDGRNKKVPEDSYAFASPTFEKEKPRWKGWVIVDEDDEKYDRARPISWRSQKRKRDIPANDEEDSRPRGNKRARSEVHPSPTSKITADGNTPMKVEKHRVTRSKTAELPRRKSARGDISTPFNKITRSPRPLPNTAPIAPNDGANESWVYPRGKPLKDGSWGHCWRYDVEINKSLSGSHADRYVNETPGNTSSIESLSKLVEVVEPPPGSSKSRDNIASLDIASKNLALPNSSEVAEPPSRSSIRRVLHDQNSTFVSPPFTFEELSASSASRACDQTPSNDMIVVPPSKSVGIWGVETSSGSSMRGYLDDRPIKIGSFVTPATGGGIGTVKPSSDNYACRNLSELPDDSNVVTSRLEIAEVPPFRERAAAGPASQGYEQIRENAGGFKTPSKRAETAVVELSSGGSTSRAFSELPDDTSFTISLATIAAIRSVSKVEPGVGSCASRGLNRLPKKNNSIESPSKLRGISALERPTGFPSFASPDLSRRENSKFATPSNTCKVPAFRGHTAAGNFARQYYADLGRMDRHIASPSSLRAKRVVAAAEKGGGFSTFVSMTRAGLFKSPNSPGNEEREKPGKLKRPTRISNISAVEQENEGPDEVWAVKAGRCDQRV